MPEWKDRGLKYVSIFLAVLSVTSIASTFGVGKLE